jgi:methylated-DNA-protein-cysteine methyltransferase-like protein
VVRLKSQVLAVVAAIPEGRVTTYGAIGQQLRVTARQVAFILATLTVEESERIPWFRVVAANGVVSSTKLGASAEGRSSGSGLRGSLSHRGTRSRTST